MRYLIDTDWVIHHLNGRPDIIQRLQALQVPSHPNAASEASDILFP